MIETDYQKQGTDFLKKTNTKMVVRFLRYSLYFPDDKEKRDVYRITLIRGIQEYTFSFGQSITNSLKNRKKPDAYDILSGLEKYPIYTFEDFCANYGHDTDSRKAEKIYHACKDQYGRLCTLFNDKEMEELQEIQ